MAETLRRILAGAIAEEGWGEAQKTVPTGTAETLGDADCQLVIISHDDGAAENGNTAVVWIAGPGLSISPASGGIPMRPDEVLILPAISLDDLYCLSETANQVLNMILINPAAR